MPYFLLLLFNSVISPHLSATFSFATIHPINLARSSPVTALL